MHLLGKTQNNCVQFTSKKSEEFKRDACKNVKILKFIILLKFKSWHPRPAKSFDLCFHFYLYNLLYVFRLSPNGEYLPVVFIDELGFRSRDLIVSLDFGIYI